MRTFKNKKMGGNRKSNKKRVRRGKTGRREKKALKTREKRIEKKKLIYELGNEIKNLISNLEDEKYRLGYLDSGTTNKIENLIKDTNSLLKEKNIQKYENHKNKMIEFLNDTRQDINYIINLETGNLEDEEYENLLTELTETTQSNKKRAIDSDFRNATSIISSK